MRVPEQRCQSQMVKMKRNAGNSPLPCISCPQVSGKTPGGMDVPTNTPKKILDLRLAEIKMKD